ncbi:MAG: sigma-54-dependent Fis family transcriptional regulator [Pirellulales bacterium]|nr:sigma-54-dependent Fis family transcriptional regulator [Pirellulales bacterium]
MSSILIVDDEESICWGLSRLLGGEGHAVSIASSAEEALEKVPHARPDLVVLDVRLPGMDGLTAMSKFREAAGPVPIVVITAFGSLNTAVAALNEGAFDYLPKPFDLDQAAAVIHRALALPDYDTDIVHSAAAVPSDDGLYGTSPAMQEVFKRIALVAPTDAAVLIGGESGTGKELVARAIHRHSQRATACLVPVNLASLSPTLVESELFGHVKGAFTGATASRQGLLELANGATVFFDEAGDIPLSVQVKLLRVLEQHEATPVGDTRPRRTSFRVVAATNRDLRRECAEGRFRQDLFFRLAVFEIQLPPLRERREDIPALAELFLRRWSNFGQGAPILLAKTVQELCRRDWPGNVRELRNAIEHGALMARSGAIAPEHLPPTTGSGELTSADSAAMLPRHVREWTEQQLNGPEQSQDLYERFLNVAEPALFDAVLAATNQNRAQAATLLGIHRATLRKKLNGDLDTD